MLNNPYIYYKLILFSSLGINGLGSRLIENVVAMLWVEVYKDIIEVAKAKMIYDNH